MVVCLSRSSLNQCSGDLVPCHSSELISSPSLSLTPLFQPASFCTDSPRWCLHGSLLHLRSLLDLSDRSLAITLYKITAALCASVNAFFLGSACHIETYCVFVLCIACFLSPACRLVPEGRDVCLSYLLCSLLCPQCLEW